MSELKQHPKVTLDCGAVHMASEGGRMAYTLASKRTWTTHPCSPGQSPFRGCDGLREGTEVTELCMRRNSFFQMLRSPGKSRTPRGLCSGSGDYSASKHRVSDVLVLLQTRQTETQ